MSLFGLIPTGHPPITTPTSTPSPTSLLYTLPLAPYTHIVVFLLPGAVLPPATAAAIYLSSSPTPSPADFKFLGGIGPGKESAIFKLSPAAAAQPHTIGISIEPGDAVDAQMAALAATGGGSANTETALVKVGAKADTLTLAQRIIENAFNFLASYAERVPGSVEVVPLKAFQQWWEKFEGRVKRDPGFLERADGG